MHNSIKSGIGVCEELGKKLGYLCSYDRNTDTQLFLSIYEGKRAKSVVDSPELLMCVTRIKNGSMVESFSLKVRGNFASLDESKAVKFMGKRDASFVMKLNNHSFGLRCFPDSNCSDNIIIQTTSGLRMVAVRDECNPWPIVAIVAIGVAGIVSIVAIDAGASLKIDVEVGGAKVSVDVNGGDDGGGEEGGDSGGGEGDGGGDGGGENGDGGGSGDDK
jgi:hypothetical protein